MKKLALIITLLFSSITFSQGGGEKGNDECGGGNVESPDTIAAPIGNKSGYLFVAGCLLGGLFIYRKNNTNK